MPAAAQLRSGLLATLVALFFALPSGAAPSAPTAAGTAHAHVAGSVAKPAQRFVRRPAARKARQRPPATPKVVLPNDPLWNAAWSLAKVRAPGAWNVTAGQEQTVIAVLDTGVDASQPDLQGALVAGWDAVNEDADPSDDHGHGTLVAGVIAARSNNGVGAAGACPRCSIMPVKVIGGNGVGNAADIAEGIAWAADRGARVINMSFTMSGPDEGVAAAVAHAQAHGALVVAAAGNAGTPDATFPATLPGVLSVTGTDSSDGRYGWASYGSWVTVAAPGCSQSTALGGGYGEFCGTSSAAAFASGVAGLARSASPGAAADAVIAALATQSVRVGDFVAAGRVDAEAAVASLAPAPTAAAPAAAAPVKAASAAVSPA